MNQFFRYQNAAMDEAVIEIHADRVADRIPEALFGKFTEHLGRNIYNGMWSQVLRNPEFEPRSILGPPAGQRREEQETDVGDPALYWVRYGEGEAAFSFDRDCVSPPHSQKMEVASVAAGEVGLMQRVFLPLHRVEEFELELWAKGIGLRHHVAITIRDASTGQELCSAQVPAPDETWKAYRRELKLPAAPRGEPLDFIISVSEPGTLWLDHMILFPKDNIAGFDPDVIHMLKDARLPLLRWPGGNFSSGYHWEDGIGPTERRPTLRNPAWRDRIEYNHVGTDEFVAFCREVGCEPMICVNAGDGTPEEAAGWVEYCNGGKETRYGASRAANGHPKPYNILWWEIGNELYGSWQIGNCTPNEYANRYRRFFDEMKAADPRIKIVACGNDTKWNAPLIEKDSDILRSVSLHTLVGQNLNKSYSARESFETLMAYTWHYDAHLRGLKEQMARKVPEPKIALTELQIFIHAPDYPTNDTMSEALFFSGILHSCIRQGGLVEMITHSALVNHGGGLRKQREIVFANPVHWAHHLYANQPGRRPVALEMRCAQFSVPKRIWPAVEGVPYLDPVALLDATGNVLCLIVANRHPEQALTALIDLHGLEPGPDVRVSQVAADSFLTKNTLEEPDRVRIEESTARIDGTQLSYAFPPHSLTALQFQR